MDTPLKDPLEPDSKKRYFGQVSAASLPSPPDRTRSPKNIQMIKDLINEQVSPLKDEIIELKRQLMSEQNERKLLQEKLTKMETFSRRANLRFEGVQEHTREGPLDCKKTILNILSHSGLNLNPIAIVRAHRLGPHPKTPNQGRARPIIVKFFHEQEKEMVLENKRVIKNACNVFVNEDFPEVVNERRKALTPILLNAQSKINERHKPKFNAKLIVDKLIVDSKVYTTENLHTLPEELKPENVFTQSKDNKTAFFTKNSPFSNMYPSKLKKKWCCLLM